MHFDHRHGVCGRKRNDIAFIVTNDLATVLKAESKFTKALKMALSLTHSFTNPVTYNGVTYKYEVRLGRFDITYKF